MGEQGYAGLQSYPLTTLTQTTLLHFYAKDKDKGKETKVKSKKKKRPCQQGKKGKGDNLGKYLLKIGILL